MSAPVEWRADGTPHSARFDEVYRCASRDLGSARHVFLDGCGLPAAWAGQPRWRILQSGFGLGLNFLAAWRAWKDDPQRPRMLHFAAIEPWPAAAEDIVRSAAGCPELAPLAQELADRWWELGAGFHRFSFDGGRVLLTVCVGDARVMLREQAMRADTVFLDGFAPQHDPAMWGLPTLKAVARLCRRGAPLATWTDTDDVRRDLRQCGFRLTDPRGLPALHEGLRGVYDPAWRVKGLDETPEPAPGRCAVIGGGLAGAAAAASFARRGWEVVVLDAAQAPAQGASALPAGLMAPHLSPDDNLLSRLSRAGIRITLQEAHASLRGGEDWEPSGVHTRSGGALVWNDKAGWIRPAALVRAWLAQDGITWRGGARVQRIARDGAQHVLLAADEGELARADLVIVAAALDSARLLGGRLQLNAVRGQVSWGWRAPDDELPATPLNGNGHFIPRAPVDGREAWLTGSTYDRGDTSVEVRAGDHLANLERLRTLAPEAAERLVARFEHEEVQAWAGVRCTSADRRPLVGFVEPGLAVLTALGSRGLTFAALCAELLAASVHGEPLPLPRKLADALAVARQLDARATAPSAAAR